MSKADTNIIGFLVISAFQFVELIKQIAAADSIHVEIYAAYIRVGDIVHQAAARFFDTYAFFSYL